MVKKTTRKFWTPYCHPERPFRSKGLCESCYTAHLRGERDHSAFVKRHEEEKLKWHIDCAEGRKQRAKKRRESNPFLYKCYLKRYGLTKEIYHQMVFDQKGCCLICEEQQEDTMHIDHCHKTGKVRGMLCRKCNNFLGYLEGFSTERIQRSFQYLEDNKEKP